MFSPISMSEMSRFVDSPRAEVAKRPSKKRKDSTQPPPVCKICGDRAESRHYGVFACNGCKGFFRRSVWNNRKYICRHRDDCKIVKEQRNKCRSCRLKTCLAVGMNPKAVQYERDGASVNMKIEDRSDKPGSKLLKASTSECSQQTEAAYIERGGGLIMQEAAHSLSPLPEQLDQAALLVQIYRRVVSRVDPPESFTGGKDIPFHIALRHPSLVTRRKEIRLTAERIATEEDILDECRRQFVLSVDWINAIPEYQQLPEDVQYTIAKRRITEFAWFFQAWNAIITGCEGMCFLNGSYFPADPKLQILPDIKGANRLFRQNLLAPLKEMNFDETELCIVQALVLFTPGK
uniref:Uncharacterized protein n=1 Tax=Plectus sambesii TaxID=2011161 RepID=A0A914WT99_9BILA